MRPTAGVYRWFILLGSLWLFTSLCVAASASIQVERFLFSGNSAISSDELAEIARPYRGRAVTAAELQQLQLRLSQYYIAKGYINSGVLIEPQSVDDGSLNVTVIEGRLSQTEIFGLQRLPRDYIQGYLRHYVDLDGVLNMPQLQAGLGYLQSDALIAEIRGHVRPTSQLGQARLELQIEEADPWKLQLSVDNYGVPALGEWRAGVQAESLNLTGHADRLDLNAFLAEGLNNYELSYRLPLNQRRTELSLSYASADSVVIDNDFKDLDIRSKTVSQKLLLNQPLWLTIEQQLSLSVGYLRKQSKTSILGVPFSFSAGYSDGEVTTQGLLLGQRWQRQQLQRTLALNSTFTLGFDPVLDQSRADGQFVAWAADLRWLERWSSLNGQLVVNSKLRLSDDTLLATDKPSLGGRYSVRGYRENRYSVDNSAALSLEWQRPILQAQVVNWLGDHSGAGLMLAAFYDVAEGWDRESSAPPQPAARHTLSSYGLGVIGKLDRHLQFELYGAVPIQSDANSGSSLQESGLYLQLLGQVF